jgi:hypothetical protein
MDPQAMKQLVFAALLCALAACHPAPSAPVAATLIESHPKAGFDFATSRPVEVRISAESKLLAELRDAEGKATAADLPIVGGSAVHAFN